MTDPEALVVAGGRSTRFAGGDKALAPLDGVPLVRRVAAALAPVTDGLVVNCRRDQRSALADALAGFDPRFATDTVPDRGPVAGLLTGLRAVATPRTVVAACDQPFLAPADVRTLREAAGDADGAAFTVDGAVQPFPAVLRTGAAREVCATTLACGADRLCEVVSRLDPVLASPPVANRLDDVDSRSDLADGREAVADDRNAVGDSASLAEACDPAEGRTVAEPEY